jgi:hypothetical protein
MRELQPAEGSVTMEEGSVMTEEGRLEVTGLVGKRPGKMSSQKERGRGKVVATAWYQRKHRDSDEEIHEKGGGRDKKREEVTRIVCIRCNSESIVRFALPRRSIN